MIKLKRGVVKQITEPFILEVKIDNYPITAVLELNDLGERGIMQLITDSFNAGGSGNYANAEEFINSLFYEELM